MASLCDTRMIQKLPLFPLNTVLFPGSTIGLVIFEERYRQMIGRCLEQHTPFGVVLIRSGSEVDPNDPYVKQMRESAGLIDPGEPQPETVPYQIGTVARINESIRLEDGRYWLRVAGQRRFRVQYLLQRQPYLVASVVHLQEETPPEVLPETERLRALYQHYWSTLEAATGQSTESDPLPDDPVELSYALAHRLRVDTTRKQHWLEADLTTRLREIGAAIQIELSLFPKSGPRTKNDTPWTWN